MQMINRKSAIVMALVLVFATVMPMTLKAVEEDDGYSYPPGATEEQKKQIDEKEKQMWLDAECPGVDKCP